MDVHHWNVSDRVRASLLVDLDAEGKASVFLNCKDRESGEPIPESELTAGERAEIQKKIDQAEQDLIASLK